MPKTKFQEVIFGIIMVCVMVYGMICYNLALPAGKLEPYMFLEAAKTLPLVGLIAFLVEFFFAGPLVRLIFRTIFERNPERAAQMQERLSKEPAYEKNTVVE